MSCFVSPAVKRKQVLNTLHFAHQKKEKIKSIYFTNFIYTENCWMYLEWQLLVRALQFFWKHNMTLAGGFTSQFLHQPVMTTFQQNISSRHKFKAGRLSLSLFFFLNNSNKLENQYFYDSLFFCTVWTLLCKLSCNFFNCKSSGIFSRLL